MKERKIIKSEVIDLDENQKRVKIAIASMSEVDSDNDIFSPGAFDRSIKERGPKGSKSIWHLLDHGYTIRNAALSKPLELFVENQKLVMISAYRESFNWREVAWPAYVARDITEHSVGFTTTTSRNITIDGKQVRQIDEVMLFEGSAVLWGANDNTDTLDVMKSYKSLREREDRQPIEKRLNILYEDIKSGRYSGENESLLQIELQCIETYFNDLKNSKVLPVNSEDPTEKEAKAWSEVFELMKQF